MSFDLAFDLLNERRNNLCHLLGFSLQKQMWPCDFLNQNVWLDPLHFTYAGIHEQFVLHRLHVHKRNGGSS